jgi:hypothetical protein
MLQSTLDVLKSVLRSDPTVSPTERAQLLAQIRQGGRAAPTAPVLRSEPRLVRRAEAARRLSCSLRTVDSLAATGVLKKRKLPGRVRASGFLLADVEALIVATGEASSPVAADRRFAVE